MPKIWNLQSKIIFPSRIECRPVPSWNMTRSTFKKGVKIMGLGQWGKKKNCCKMFSLAANQTCGFSKPSKTVNKSYLSCKIVLVAKRIYFKVRKVKCVTKNTCQLGMLKYPMNIPTGLSEINLFCIFLCSFWWNMLPEANHRQYSQNSHFQYGRHEKMP